MSRRIEVVGNVIAHLDLTVDTLVSGSMEEKRYLGLPQIHRNHRGDIRWNVLGNTPKENEQIAIENIQGIFIAHFPEFFDRFPRGEDRQIAKDKQLEAKKYIWERVGNAENFRDIFGATPCNARTVPCFEGSYMKVLYKSFFPWGVDFTEETLTRRIDKKTGRFVDESGTSWVPIFFYQKNYGIGNKYAMRLLTNAATLEGKDSQGRPTRLYREDDVNERLHRLIATKLLPGVDRKTGRYTDQTGRQWVAGGRLARDLEVTDIYLSQYLRGAPCMQGRGAQGRETVLYDEVVAREKIAPFLALPRIDQETGIYRNEDQEKWVTEFFLSDNYDIEYTTLAVYLEQLRSQPGRTKDNHRCMLYSLSDADKLLADRRALPRIGRQTGRYIDTEDVRWVALQFFQDTFAIDSKTLGPLIKKYSIPSQKGRGKINLIVDLYPEDQILEALEAEKFFDRRRRRDAPQIHLTPEEARDELQKLLEVEDE